MKGESWSASAWRRNRKAETPLPHVRRGLRFRPGRATGERTARARGPFRSVRRTRWKTFLAGTAAVRDGPAGRMPDVLKRYGLALVLAGLALFSAARFPSRKAPPSISSHRGGGPGRLVWRTRTRLVRFADLRNGSSVLVYPSGEIVRTIAGLCAWASSSSSLCACFSPSSVRGAGVPSTRCGRARSALHLLGRCGRRAHDPCRGWNSRRREPASV